MLDYFGKFGRVERVKILPQKGPNLSAFVDFEQRDDAMDAHESEHRYEGALLRTDYNSRAQSPPGGGGGG